MHDPRIRGEEPVSDRQIVISRELDAPRELVFAAWTQPEALERWWGPRGFTTTTHAFAFRPGGAWRLTMHGPDGTDYPSSMVYDEIVHPERIVYSLRGGSDEVVAQLQATVTFEARGDRTRITMRSVFPSAKLRDEVEKKHHAIEGGRQTLERLAEHLRARGNGAARAPDLRLTRVFDAPRARVFDAWTRPEHLARWWGPQGFTLPTCKVDLRPGGAFRFVMRGPDGTDYPFEGEYRDVDPPGRLMFTGTIDDVPGHEVMTTVTFDEAAGTTTVTVHQTYSFESDATRGAREGWSQSLERLTGYLAARR
ncbi:MAG TPA: SRPBCC domain-containing protein [Polyangia bacterium]|jgi:uncharacterized protein YndB with AHSA1/START domain